MIKGSKKPMQQKLGNYIPEPNSGCHLWLGSLDKDGYGTIRRVDGSHLKAHRESYSFYVCDPGETQVLHKCDVPCCINPDHLYEGNPTLNGLDKKNRKRAKTQPRPGCLNPMAKLTEDIVIDIRKRYLAGEQQKYLAIEYGIRQGTISKLVNNQRWVI